jgi:hypothetical protein
MRTIKSNQHTSKVASCNNSKAKEHSAADENRLVFTEPFQNYQKLDPAKYGRMINSELSDEELAMANDPNVKPFAHVNDSAKYVRSIRKTIKP